jgi:hypothetical protein
MTRDIAPGICFLLPLCQQVECAENWKRAGKTVARDQLRYLRCKFRLGHAKPSCDR